MTTTVTASFEIWHISIEVDIIDVSLDPFGVRVIDGDKFFTQAHDTIGQYSIVTVLTLRYSLRASLPKSFPNPDCLKPPKGAATSVLL